ncbi:MAG: leucine-rich repeat protein [Ruminococcus sp.]
MKANGRTYKVTAIASGAFKNCRKLRQVTIARNISSIGTSAFQGCSALRTVKIGSKVSSIGKKHSTTARPLLLSAFSPRSLPPVP